MKHKTHMLGAFIIAILIAVLSVIPATAQEYKKMPGYIDFEAMNAFGETDPTVEVFLKGALLKMAIEAICTEEPDLCDALDGVSLVRVNVFEMDRRTDEDAIFQNAETIAKDLEAKGWDIVVRVRDEYERVYVHALPGKTDEELEGLAVMVVEEGDEAVFVNIVGNIRPADLARLGRSFDIDALEDLDLDKYDRDDDDDDDRRSRRTNRRD